jgi:RNA polymerase-binding transcription factor DksA
MPDIQEKIQFIAKVQISHARAIRKGKICEECEELLDPTNVEHSPFVVLCPECNTAIAEEYANLSG